MATTGGLDGAAVVTGSDRLWDSAVGHDIAFLLARGNAVSLSLANAALAAHGLKVRSYSVLSLVAAGTRPTQRELSEFLRLDPSQIVALVDELESQGLVRREPDPADRRANVVVATTAGIERAEAGRAAAQAAETAMLASIGPDAVAQLAAVLRVVAGAPGASSAL